MGLLTPDPGLVFWIGHYVWSRIRLVGEIWLTSDQ